MGVGFLEDKKSLIVEEEVIYVSTWPYLSKYSRALHKKKKSEFVNSKDLQPEIFDSPKCRETI